VWSLATGGSETQASEHQYPLASTQLMTLSKNRATVINSGYRTYGNSGVHSSRASKIPGDQILYCSILHFWVPSMEFASCRRAGT
jgi:hypothetical protein